MLTITTHSFTHHHPASSRWSSWSSPWRSWNAGASRSVPYRTPQPSLRNLWRRRAEISSDKPLEPKASHQVASRWTFYRPVCPICQRTSAWRIWATWRGMARSRRLLEWRPVACQNPEPSDKLVRRNGRDDCHDCHFCVPLVALQGAEGSGAAETRETKM